MQSKKIVFLIRCMTGGGAERVVSLLSREFADRGYKLTLILTHQSEEEALLHTVDDRVKVISLSDEVKCDSTAKKKHLMKKELLQKKFRQIFGRYDDNEFTVRKYEIRNYDLYRYNQNSISRDVSPDSLKSKESLHVYHKALYYLSKWGLNNEDGLRRLNARWFNDTMYLFCKYCERVKTFRKTKNIVLLKWDSLLPEECIIERNKYENRVYQNLYGWIKSNNTLKIYIFFLKKQIYTNIKRFRRHK